MTGIRKPNRRHVAALARFGSGEWCLQSGKVCFVNLLSAERALGEVARRDPGRDRLHAYRCADCGDFHIGHIRAVSE